MRKSFDLDSATAWCKYADWHPHLVCIGIEGYNPGLMQNPIPQLLGDDSGGYRNPRPSFRVIVENVLNRRSIFECQRMLCCICKSAMQNGKAVLERSH